MPSSPLSSTTLARGRKRKDLRALYGRLLSAYGPQGWWPGATPFEVIVGAILTQRVAWSNVERAIAALKEEGLLEPEALRRASLARVAHLIRPSVYYNDKARKLRVFLDFLHERYGGSLDRLLSLSAESLREELLLVRGIGEETADAIILYAAGKPSFVVDAYTRRVLSRLGLAEERAHYAALRALFMESLPRDSRLYNEYHALFVRHGKERCRPRRPACSGCPLADLCSFPVERG
jgi:endonuclease-3 related protein